MFLDDLAKIIENVSEDAIAIEMPNVNQTNNKGRP